MAPIAGLAASLGCVPFLFVAVSPFRMRLTVLAGPWVFLEPSSQSPGDYLAVFSRFLHQLRAKTITEMDFRVLLLLFALSYGPDGPNAVRARDREGT